MSYLYEPDSQQAPKTGLLLLQGLVLLVFFVFSLRLWYLQVHKGEHFSELARENQLRQESLDAPRGQIRGRNGTLLAINEPGYALGLVREDCKDLDATLAQVSEWTGADIETLKKRYKQLRSKVKPFEPLTIVPDLPYDLLAKIEANAIFWPELEILIRPRRMYPQGADMTHILGYVKSVDVEDLQEDKTLSMQDVVGKQGLELVLEKRLRGQKGLQQLEVDATGRKLNNTVLKSPKAGEDIILSIDIGLQDTASKELRGHAGGIVVMDPFTGKLLALVTQPDYDNNIMAAGISVKQYNVLRSHPRSPLMNRAIQSVYPPGSVWKLLMAGCGLQHGFITPQTRVYCPGYYTLGSRVFRCWKKHGHGSVDLKEALIHSCDVYFYQLGERLGVDRISEYAFACGFGKKTGIELPHEKNGLVPTRKWKRKRFNDSWHGGENLNLSIGQGYTQAHPLQVARFISALVNGGKLLQPSVLEDSPPIVVGDLPLSDQARELILDSMVQTVNRGTARRIKRPDARIGGKTGTAQVVKIGEIRQDVKDMPYKFRDHAWLATFGEKDDKAYVVVAIIEHGGHGGSEAGPIVKKVYDYLFGEYTPQLTQNTASRPAPQ